MMPLPTTMTPKVCERCQLGIFVNENGSLYEDVARRRYHTKESCLAVRLGALLKVAKMVQSDLKACAGHVSIAVEAELDDAIIAAEVEVD